MPIARNTFEGGMNKDLSPKAMPPNTYFDANDVTIVGEGAYASLKPIIDNRKITNIYTNNTFGNSATFDFNSYYHNEVMNILGAQVCNVIDGGEVKRGVAVFSSRAVDIIFNGNVASNDTGRDIFEIRFVTFDSDKNLDSIDLVYSKIRSVDGIYQNVSVDTELGKEGAVDVIYFTNQVDVPMRIRCTLDEFSGGQTEFADSDVELIRRASMIPPVPTVEAGGSLPCGTYQFAVRMIDETNNTYTKWSLLSNPIPVFNEFTRETSPNLMAPSGGLQEISTFKIALSLSFDDRIAEDYDYYQVAVIKGTTGTGINKVTASVLQPEFKGTATSAALDYDGEERESEISTDDIVVDEAQIESLQTLTIKNNFMIGGNIKYRDLDYDRGRPRVLTNGSAAVRIRDIAVTDTLINTGDLVGNQSANYSTLEDHDAFYFRDEVYRFAITYHDEHGNWSVPSVIDLSGQVDSEAAADCVDFKFPTLEDEPLLGSTDDKVRGMYISLSNILDHPTWAKGFAILRAERIKDIKTQTPIVPTMIVQPAEAQVLLINDETTTADDTDTDYPQNGKPTASGASGPTAVFGTVMPKNFAHGVTKHAIRGNRYVEWRYGYDDEIPAQEPHTLDQSDNIGRNEVSQAEACQYIHVIYPPTSMYNTAGATYEPYIHSPSDILEVVDVQRCDGREQQFHHPTVESNGGGNNDNVNISKDLSYAIEMTDNYINEGKANSISNLTFIPTDNRILEYIDIVAGQDKGIITTSVPGLRNNTFGDYDGIEADGLNEGFKPANQRLGVIVTSKAIPDMDYKFFDSSTGLDSGTGAPAGTFDQFTGFTNRHQNSDIDADVAHSSGPAGFTFRNTLNESNMDLKTFIAIANIKRGLSDYRYGGLEEQHNYIFTGTYVRLTDLEVANNTSKDANVYGGDCFYDLHTFKTVDTHYSIPDFTNYTDSTSSQDEINDWFIDRYGHSFTVQTGTIGEGGADSTAKYEYPRPIPVDSYSQSISVLLESESRATFMNRANFNIALVNGQTVPTSASGGDARIPFLYDYNLDFSLPNRAKIFVQRPLLDDVNNEFKARLQYSDQRIYQSNEIGFDRWRVGNIYDMDESRGAITRLVNSQDQVHALQENGVAYIPVQGQIIETIDSTNLAVRNADVIGIPQYANTVLGCQHFRTVDVAPDGYYFVDVNNKKVVKMDGNRNVNIISDMGMGSFFRDKFDNYSVVNVGLLGLYDNNRDEYILYSEESRNVGDNIDPTNDDGWSVVYSNKFGKWISQLTSDNYFGVNNGVFFDGDLYNIGKYRSSVVGIWRAYGSLAQETSPINSYALANDPYVTLFVNASPGEPKVFDVFNLDSEFRLESINAKTFDTVGNNTQEFTANIVDDSQREGSYRVPLPRDNGNPTHRLRGMFSEVRLDWRPLDDKDDPSIKRRPELFGLNTHYRQSMRNI